LLGTRRLTSGREEDKSLFVMRADSVYNRNTA
jgi:hypothetical protein